MVTQMVLAEFFTPEEVVLDLQTTDKDSTLQALVGLLQLEPEPSDILYRLLKKRENLGSTGIGKGVAIPHCRSLVVDRLRVAYARSPEGVNFGAIDNKPVSHFFLIVAPPVEISNQYLPILGKIAQFCKDSNNLERIGELGSPEEFIAILEQFDS